MTRTPIAIAAAAAFAAGLALPASAAVDAAAAEKMAKDNGCTKCHAVDKDKKGPAYKKIAGKYQGKADAEAKLVTFVTTGPKVKMDEGTEEEHKSLAGKDAGQVKNLMQWVLSQ